MSATMFPAARTGAEKERLGEILTRTVAAGLDDQADKRANWLRNWHFIHGARNFPLIDRNAGRVNALYQTETGEVGFELLDVHDRLRKEVGRLGAIDVRPLCQRKGMTLDGVRKTAAAQATLDYALERQEVERAKQQLVELVLKYGCAGLVGYVELVRTEKGKRELPRMEVVPPWELIPLPLRVSTQAKRKGMMRVRWETVDWLEARAKLGKEDREKLETADVQYAETEDRNPVDAASPGGTLFQSGQKAVSTMGKGLGPQDEDKWAQKVTRVAEIWLEGPQGTCERYLLWAGGRLLLDKSYLEGEVVMMPIAAAQMIPADDFWSVGLVDMLFSPTMWAERMIRKTFQNAEDTDAYGIVLLPNSWGISDRELVRKGGVRFGRYEVDIALPEAKVQMVQPVHAGNPAAPAQFALALTDKLAGQPVDMMAGSAPGRVDSSTALGALWQASNTPLEPVARSIASAFAVIYRWALAVIRSRWSASEVISVATLEEAMVGLRINSDDMTMELEQNALPDPRDIDVGVRSMLPVDAEKRKAELWASRQAGIISDQEFRWLAYKENLDIPIGNRAEIENRRKAILATVLLFNDGKTPGRIEMNHPLADNPAIFLLVLDEFMATVEFSLAAPPVQAAFREMKTYFQGQTAQFPQQLPYPEEAPQAAQEEAAGMGMGGGEGMQPDLAGMLAGMGGPEEAAA